MTKHHSDLPSIRSFLRSHPSSRITRPILVFSLCPICFLSKLRASISTSVPVIAFLFLLISPVYRSSSSNHWLTISVQASFIMCLSCAALPNSSASLKATPLALNDSLASAHNWSRSCSIAGTSAPSTCTGSHRRFPVSSAKNSC